ncbi:Aste57867_14326 [Aphanomyces stellatus]|uniref:Aste57867_14326 protein n=1 Tax=Aphanomyces stellatus TaxID=120398 RepID=A0A485L0C1_9STRA|nr:hypothetical protein As57867_014272 [Aphanomyces stellatus]VFT91150.1 Aste57867_14326 [Aphanomyces stellatus]
MSSRLFIVHFASAAAPTMTTDTKSLSSYLPRRPLAHLQWLYEYNIGRDLKFDFIAGLTVAMMLVPQEVSLANIMHVPAQYGLYTAAITPLIYAFLGSSPVLSVANASEVSLMVGNAVQLIKTDKERAAVAIFLSFYIGMINLVLGSVRLGILADFFSRPVMGGFLSGGGVLVMISQTPALFELSVPSSTYPLATIIGVGQRINGTNWNSFAVGAVSMALLLTLRHAKTYWLPAPKLAELFDAPPTADTQPLASPVDDHATIGFSLHDTEYTPIEPTPTSAPRPKSPSQPRATASRAHNILLFVLRTACDLGPLFVCIFGAVVAHALGEKHIKVTGKIPKGLPAAVVPWYGYNQDIIKSIDFGDVSLHAASIAIVVYMTSIAMAKRLAVRGHYEVYANQELVGIGLASAVGSFFQVMPPTGGLSRTAVNMQSAKTQLSSIITVAIVMIALTVATDAMYFIPKASLAAIIIVAGYWIVEIDEAKWLYCHKRDEFYVWVASAAATLGLGMLAGLFVSIGCSLLAILIKTKFPHVYAVTRLADGRYVNPASYAPPPSSLDEGDEMKPLVATASHGVLVVRVEGSLYFGNSDSVSQYILAQATTKSEDEVVRGVVVDAAFIHDVDATTIQILQTLHTKLAHRGVRFAIANAQSNLERVAKASKLSEGFDCRDVSLSIDAAVAQMQAAWTSDHA